MACTKRASEDSATKPLEARSIEATQKPEPTLETTPATTPQRKRCKVEAPLEAAAGAGAEGRAASGLAPDRADAAAAPGTRAAAAPGTRAAAAAQAPQSPAPLSSPPEEVAGFVRTLFTLLRVCDPAVISWSDDGAAMVIRDPARFASEVCPKFFRHRNFNSFTRLLNMYQFHKVPGTGRDKSVTFTHAHFRQQCEGRLWLIQRKGAVDRGDRDDESKEESAKRRHDAADRKTKREGDRAAAKAAAASKAQKAQARPGAASEAQQATTPDCGGSRAVSTWMRRVVELEIESKRLGAENVRLRVVEAELDVLRQRVTRQSDFIAALQDGCASMSPGDAVENMAAALSNGVGGQREPAPAALPMPDMALWHHVIGASSGARPPCPRVPRLAAPAAANANGRVPPEAVFCPEAHFCDGFLDSTNSLPDFFAAFDPGAPPAAVEPVRVFPAGQPPPQDLSTFMADFMKLAQAQMALTLAGQQQPAAA